MAESDSTLCSRFLQSRRPERYRKPLTTPSTITKVPGPVRNIKFDSFPQS